ncbi:hypothetical protein [Nocardia sp. MW-W600-9]
MADAPWRTYEEVAQDVVDRIGNMLGLERVEGKQKLVGKLTTWEVEGKGVKLGGEGFVVMECRRYPGRKLTQEAIGAFAFRLQDLGAAGGLIVSPLDLQEGARRIAAGTGIVHVRLDADSTKSDFVVRFLNQVVHGASAQTTIGWDMTAEVEVTRPER